MRTYDHTPVKVEDGSMKGSSYDNKDKYAPHTSISIRSATNNKSIVVKQ
jgi:hypothetical protein